jgi:hypothetical protein
MTTPKEEGRSPTYSTKLPLGGCWPKSRKKTDSFLVAHVPMTYSSTNKEKLTWNHHFRINVRGRHHGAHCIGFCLKLCNEGS